MFPPAAPELFFAQWYKRYGVSTLVKCKGDGEIATSTPDFAKGLEKIGEDERGFIQVKCLGPECPYQKGDKPQCSRMASLQIILPDLVGMGVWQINTGSYNSIVNMNSAIDWLRGLCGRYAMIPITLMRVETDIQYEGRKTKHYILQVDQQSFSIGDIQKFVAATPVERALITAPDESKDALFYDKNGQKPAPLPEKPQEEEKKSPESPIEQRTEAKDTAGKEKPIDPKKMAEWAKESKAKSTHLAEMLVGCKTEQDLNRMIGEIKPETKNLLEEDKQFLNKIVTDRRSEIRREKFKK